MENYREIVEKYIGRKLLSTEIIHHKDGNKYNNNKSNLEILPNKSIHALKPRVKYHITDIQLNNLLEKSEDLTFQSFKKSIKQFFTSYQINIIIRKAENLPLSKTDSEVFSRSIKKKLVALSDENLYNIACRIKYKL